MYISDGEIRRSFGGSKLVIWFFFGLEISGGLILGRTILAGRFLRLIKGGHTSEVSILCQKSATFSHLQTKNVRWKHKLAQTLFYVDKKDF